MVVFGNLLFMKKKSILVKRMGTALIRGNATICSEFFGQ